MGPSTISIPNNQTDKLLRKRKILKSIKDIRLLKTGIWLYFFLLIFEGALRKWFLPGLSTPLLIIRDPLACFIVILAWKQGRLVWNHYMSMMGLIGITGIYTAFFLGHGNLMVALYGARIMLFHFPLIFVIGHIFKLQDVITMGKVILWITVPMTLLIMLQFYSPQSAWINRGIGGNLEGAGFGGALGYFRPPGTFSFTNGTSLFYAFVASFVFYFWIDSKSINRLLLILATASLLAAIPLSISRGLFFSVIVSLIFALLAIFREPKYWSQIIIICLGILTALLVLNQAAFFQTAFGAFSSRFESANEIEGGLESVFLDRFFGGMINALAASSDQPFWGYGLGMGTNVGSMLLTGKATYLISEGEWGRLIGELGPVMGLMMIYLRLGLCIKVAFACYKKLSQGNFLPWMILSFGSLSLAQGQWAQPTSLGFSILGAGLMIASLKRRRLEGRVHA